MISKYGLITLFCGLLDERGPPICLVSVGHLRSKCKCIRPFLGPMKLLDELATSTQELPLRSHFLVCAVHSSSSSSPQQTLVSLTLSQWNSFEHFPLTKPFPKPTLLRLCLRLGSSKYTAPKGQFGETTGVLYNLLNGFQTLLQ